MKFAIKHEIKGRLRVHMAQQRMTYEQADVLQYYLQQSDLVVDAKVYEQTTETGLLLFIYCVPSNIS